MPSGAKKRKSSKRPMPKGESGPELEAGPEETMEDTSLEVGDGIPSPRGIEGESEALAERGLEAKEMYGEASKERNDESESPYKNLPTDEAAADQVDPPSQAYPDSEIPSSIKPEVPVEIEPNEKPVQEERERHSAEEPAQNETKPQVDTALRDNEAKADPFVEDMKPETQLDDMPALRDNEAKVDPFVEDMKPETRLDDMPTDSEPVIDATPATSAKEVKPDADDGLDEVQSSEKSARVERGSVYEAGPIGSSEAGIDASPADMETKTDAPSDDLAPAINDDTHTGIPSAEAESDVCEPPVGEKSESDTTLTELQASNASDETPMEAEQEMDGAPAESKPEVGEVQVEELGAAAPVDTKPDTEEAPAMERELDTHAALTIADREDAPEKEIALDGQPDMTSAPADTAAETDYVGQGTDPSANGTPPVVGTFLSENPPEADISPDEPPSETSVAKKERNETDLDENAEQVDAEHNGASVAEIKGPPALESEMEAFKDPVPEENLGGEETSTGTEAKPELQLEAETVSKPEDLIEDIKLENLLETESEAKVDAIEEARPEDEAGVETKPEETGPVRSDVDGQDLVEEGKAVPEYEAEPEAETSRGIELEGENVDAQGETVDAEPESEVETSRGMEMEAETVDPEPVPEVKTSPGIELGAEAVETEPEPAAEARFDLDEEGERGHCETQSGQLDLVQVEPDQARDQQPEKQEAGEYVGELATSVTEVRQSLESEAQVADASEVPDKENECAAISAFDEGHIVEDSTSSESSSESSDHGEAEKTVIKPEPENGDDIPPPATALRGEGEGGVSHYNQESSVEDEQSKGVAGDIEEGAADEIRDESKEDTNMQDRAVNAGHVEGEGVVALGGSGDETEGTSKRELATNELPLDAIAESTMDIGDQERTVDVWHDEDGALLGSAGKSAEVEEQELHVELPPAATFTVEEPTKEGPPPSDPELFTKQHHFIDEDDRSVPVDEPPRVASEQNLKATTPAESETFHSASAPLDEAITQATDEKVASEHEFPLESACGESEKDVGEEEAASSTVAEAGSVLNDFDERASYEQDLLSADFTAIDRDMDTSDSKESDGDLETEAPEYARTGSEEQVHVESQQEAAKPAEGIHSALSEEASCDEQSPLLQPEQAAQGSGQDSICSPKEEALGIKELKADGEEKATLEDDEVAASPIPESALPVFSGDEIVSKALIHLGNGQQSMSNPEGVGREHRVEYSAERDANGTEETEIHAMEARELKEADLHKPMGYDTGSGADKSLVESPPTPEDRDIEDVQAFRQETTKEANQGVVVPTQDRSLEPVNMESMEQRSRGDTVAVEGRRKILGCCGLLDVLLGKN